MSKEVTMRNGEVVDAEDSEEDDEEEAEDA